METRLVIAVGVLVAIQLALQVTALVQLVRTPSERVTIGGRKWVWALIILLGELVGPILWFVIGRTPYAPPTPGEQGAGLDASSARSAVDTLYGKDLE